MHYAILPLLLLLFSAPAGAAAVPAPHAIGGERSGAVMIEDRRGEHAWRHRFGHRSEHRFGHRSEHRFGHRSEHRFGKRHAERGRHAHRHEKLHKRDFRTRRHLHGRHLHGRHFRGRDLHDRHPHGRHFRGRDLHDRHLHGRRLHDRHFRGKDLHDRHRGRFKSDRWRKHVFRQHLPVPHVLHSLRRHHLHGFSKIRRRGGHYHMHAYDRFGQGVALVVDAFSGRILLRLYGR